MKRIDLYSNGERKFYVWIDIDKFSGWNQVYGLGLFFKNTRNGTTYREPGQNRTNEVGISIWNYHIGLVVKWKDMRKEKNNVEA